MKKNILSVIFLSPTFKLFLISITLFLLLFFSCNTTEPPPFKEEPPKAIKLKLLDASCTEAFIKVTAADSVLPVAIILKKDNTALFSFTLTKTDTTVIDTTLQPNITYTYQTTALIKGKEENSDTIKVKTLNTTSHNFTWQKFEFGGIGGSSVLNDVAIIDENNIWAVGEIYADTTGQAYNAVYWNGTSWELKRISVEYHGYQITPPLYGIFTFSSIDIWLSSGVPVHGNGTNWTQYHLFDMGVLGKNDGYLTKIWGESSSDIYYVGTLGTIAHYRNGSWSKIESGTNLWINDIYGSVNPITDKTDIICVAADFFQDRGVQVITINENNTTELIDNSGLIRFIVSVWFKPGIKYYIVGNGLYEKKNIPQSGWIDLNYNRSITSNLMGCIRGNGLNDIIVTGSYGEVIHFNGLSWKSIKNETTTLINGAYSRVAVKGNLVVAVGNDDIKGVILVGHR